MGPAKVTVVLKYFTLKCVLSYSTAVLYIGIITVRDFSQQNYYADTNLDGLILNSVSLSLNPSWNKFFVAWL